MSAELVKFLLSDEGATILDKTIEQRLRDALDRAFPREPEIRISTLAALDALSPECPECGKPAGYQRVMVNHEFLFNGVTLVGSAAAVECQHCANAFVREMEVEVAEKEAIARYIRLKGAE